MFSGVDDEHTRWFTRWRGGGRRKTDPERLTALVPPGLRDQSQFPLIFHHGNCANMRLAEDDIHSAFIAQARAVVAMGTHLSHPRVEAATPKAPRLARKNGQRTAWAWIIARIFGAWPVTAKAGIAMWKATGLPRTWDSAYGAHAAGRAGQAADGA